MLSNTGHRAKRSKLERAINAEIVSQFAILFVLCLIGAISKCMSIHVDTVHVHSMSLVHIYALYIGYFNA